MQQRNSSATSSISTSHFHQAKGFDYERFYHSIYGLASPLIDSGFVKFTTTFVIRDPLTLDLYAQYYFSKNSKTLRGIPNTQNYLANVRIPLYNHEKEQLHDEEGFVIQRLFKAFFSKDPIFLQGNILDTYSLAEYMAEELEEITEAEFKDIEYKKLIPAHFRTAERNLVETLLASGQDPYNEGTSEFFPFPIIGAGGLRGILYLIYDKSHLKQEGVDDLWGYFRTLMLQITREYERLLLDTKLYQFSPVPEDPLDEFKMVFHEFEEAKYRFAEPLDPKLTYPRLEDQPFLDELGYQGYYDRLSRVLIRENEEASKGVRAQIKTAITSIIVDSFAHNVGAHALVGLKWWIENRFKILDKDIPLQDLELRLKDPQALRDKGWLKKVAEKREFHTDFSQSESAQDAGKISILDILRFMPKELEQDFLVFFNKNPNAKDRDKAEIHLPFPLDSSLYRFFEYLRDKSAFWSGATRDTIFSGRINTWEQLLQQFLGNSLFLGTLAHSEGVNKVNFFLEIVEHGKIKATGHFAEINLEVIQRERFDQPRTQEEREPHPKGYSPYAFLREGDEFEDLYPILKELDPVFLPNGVIGQQALYTILENTLRNIKHYKHELDNIRQSGLNLYLSIDRVAFIGRKDGKNHGQNLYKVGTWLHHPQNLINRDGCKINEEEQPFVEDWGCVINSHTQQLRERIINVDGEARLGGSSQDKVCASMLMNNTFQSIDEVDLDLVKRHYFPYVYAATETWSDDPEMAGKDEARTRNAGDRLMDRYLHMTYNPDIRTKVHNPAQRRENYKQEVKKYLKEHPPGSKGLIKKFFHLWVGENCLIIDGEEGSNFDRQNENLSRFKVVAVNQYRDFNSIGEPTLYSWDHEELEQRPVCPLRMEGIFRLVPAGPDLLNSPKKEQFEKAMTQWLVSWLGAEETGFAGVSLFIPPDNGIDIHQNEDIDEKNLPAPEPQAAIYLVKKGSEWTCEYANLSQMIDWVEDSTHPLTEKMVFEQFALLPLGHGETHSGKGICRVRSHGAFMMDIFKDYVFDRNKDESDDRPSIIEADLAGKPAQRFKLLETILTKISIFDDRLFARLDRSRGLELKNHLGLDFFQEKTKDFFAYRETILGDTAAAKRNINGHILILHLSFLESIPIEKGSKITYKESEVTDFFNKEIKGFYEDLHGKPLSENFMFVITSGRGGRGNWFAAMEHPQITFRPIEALASAIEDGLSQRDDFQVKYNLCNVIFGS